MTEEHILLSRDEVAGKLISLIKPLSHARIVFEGFTLPEAFGESEELEFGNLATAKALGLGQAAMETGKGFVIKTIDEFFSGELEGTVLDHAFFSLVRQENLFTLSPVGKND